MKKAPQLRLSQIFKYPVVILTIWTEPVALARDLAGRIFMSTGKAILTPNLRVWRIKTQKTSPEDGLGGVV